MSKYKATYEPLIFDSEMFSYVSYNKDTFFRVIEAPNIDVATDKAKELKRLSEKLISVKLITWRG